MTVNNQASSVSFTGNGVTTVFPYTFRIPEDGMGHVGLLNIATSVLTELTPIEYTIAGVGSDFGGTVTYNPLGVPIPATKRLVIYRDLDLVQEMDLTNQTPYLAETLEETLDRIVMMLQQVSDAADRAVKVTLGSTTSPDVLVAQLFATQAAAAASAAAAAGSAAGANASAVQAAIDAASVSPANIVHYTADGRTLAQQAIARNNVGANLLAGFRDKIINGRFDIAQRTLPAAIGPVASAFGPDRFSVTTVAGISCSLSRAQFAPGTSLGKNYLTAIFSGVGASGSFIRTKLAGVDTLQGLRATLTFAMADNVAVAGTVQVRQNFGTGGAPSAAVQVNYPFVGLGPSFGAIRLLIDLPSILGKTLGTNGDDSVDILWIPTAANAHTTSMANVSLVAGEEPIGADPTPPRHIWEEESLCKWFYEVINIGNTGLIAVAHAYATAFCLWGFKYDRKRVDAPTVTVPLTVVPLNAAGAQQVVVSHTIVAPSPVATRVTTNINAANFIAGNAAGILAGGASQITIDAEL